MSCPKNQSEKASAPETRNKFSVTDMTPIIDEVNFPGVVRYLINGRYEWVFRPSKEAAQ